MNRYEKMLRWILHGKRPVWALVSLFLLFPISVMLLMARGNKAVFFPSGDPNFIYVYLKMPPGTDVKTDSVLHVLEKRVYKVLEKEKPEQKAALWKVSLRTLPIVPIIRETITGAYNRTSDVYRFPLLNLKTSWQSNTSLSR
jgi:hypothetical protein